MRTVIIADKQDITAAGIRYICNRLAPEAPIRNASNKKELIATLEEQPGAVVVLDYTLYDIGSAEELLILAERFKTADWIMFSDDLSRDFMKQITFRSNSFSILLKDCALEEIELGIIHAVKSKRFLCARIAGIAASKKKNVEEDNNPTLTSTETEILRLIALGKTTKEIAEERFSSVHTITTHRKNIFRKAGVNNVHEATKYALRAGIIDFAEYSI
jgi:DNA-binding NarL/FixJ family response regulator